MCAKFELNKFFSEAKDAFYHAVFKGLGSRKTDLMFSKNQHGAFIGKKSRATYRITPLQTNMRNRFKECDCMFKEMTDPQKILFEWREYYFPDGDFYNMRTRDMFMSLCLKKALYKYLRYTLETKIELSLYAETKDYITLKVHFTEQDEFKHGKRLIKTEDGWAEVKLDRFHLKLGYLHIYGYKSGQLPIKIWEGWTGDADTYYIKLNKNLLSAIFQTSEIYVYAEHEKLRSNTLKISLPERYVSPELQFLTKLYIYAIDSDCYIYGYEAEWTKLVLEPYTDKQVIAIFGFENEKCLPHPDMDFEDVWLMVYDKGDRLLVEVYGTYGVQTCDLYHKDYGKICRCPPLNKDKPFEEIPPKSERRAVIEIDKETQEVIAVY